MRVSIENLKPGSDRGLLGKITDAFVGVFVEDLNRECASRRITGAQCFVVDGQIVKLTGFSPEKAKIVIPVISTFGQTYSSSYYRSEKPALEEIDVLKYLAGCVKSGSNSPDRLSVGIIDSQDLPPDRAVVVTIQLIKNPEEIDVGTALRKGIRNFNGVLGNTLYGKGTKR